MESDSQTKLVWSKLNPHDFTESGATAQDIPGVIDDLIAASPVAEIVLLFYQTELGQTKVIARSLTAENILNLTRIFAPQGDKSQATFTVLQNLEDAATLVIEAVTKQLRSFLLIN